MALQGFVYHHYGIMSNFPQWKKKYPAPEMKQGSSKGHERYLEIKQQYRDERQSA